MVCLRNEMSTGAILIEIEKGNMAEILETHLFSEEIHSFFKREEWGGVFGI